MNAFPGAPTLPLPNPGDWVTIEWAAAHLGVDRRTVHRWIGKNVLTSYCPRVGPKETKRRHVMLWAVQVEDLKAALQKVAGPGQGLAGSITLANLDKVHLPQGRR